MKKRRLATGALSIALALTMASTPAFAASMSFTDVPSDHWASVSIAEMAEKGIMTGVGNNQFAPDKTFTYAEFLTMLTRQFYSDKIGNGGEKWYDTYVGAAKDAEILTGLSIDATTNSINRYEMAQLMYNVMVKQDVDISGNFDTSKIGDWASIPANYQRAVSACYSLSTLSGTDDNGTFGGTGVMTRAQAAVVMDRLIAVCTNSATPTDIPAGAIHITTRDQLMSQQGFSASNGVFHSDGTGSAGFVSSMYIDPGGHNTITFTVRALDRDVQVVFSHKDKGRPYYEAGVSDILGVVKAGVSQTFTLNCSVYEWVNIQPGDYQWLVEHPEMNTKIADVLVECYITDIYMW